MWRSILIPIGLVFTLAACQSIVSGKTDDRSDYQKACELMPGETKPTSRLVTRSFPAKDDSKHLVVLLHGRATKYFWSQSDASAMVDHAKAMAAAVPGVSVVAIARPGYRMGKDVSDGEAYGGSDNATALNNAWIANEINDLKADHHADQLTLIGHSEGAISAAAIAACNPELVDHLLLGGCPCDLEMWVELRPCLTPFVRSPSPIRLIEKFNEDLIVRVSTAPKDMKTPDPMARAFLKAAKLRLDADGEFDGAREGHGWGKVRKYLTKQVALLNAT